MSVEEDGVEEVDEESGRLRVGEVLEGRYRVVGELGEGGIGWVYRAEHVKLGHEVAIKMLQPQYAHHAMMRPRFEREARALASLSHPHVVTLMDYSLSDGRPYLVMELLQGRTLQSLVEGGPLDEDVARHIATQMLDALAYAHAQGFVHRDLKPANIFLCALPTDAHFVKILDFGFVKLLADVVGSPQVVLTHSGVAFGTPSYMSPEQATGDSTDERTDIYAFGVLLFEMLAGRRPFVGPLPEIIRQHLMAPVPPLSTEGGPFDATPELRALLARAMAKEKGERFESAASLRDALVALPTPARLPRGRGEAETLAALPGARGGSPSLTASAADRSMGDDPLEPTAPGTRGSAPALRRRRPFAGLLGALALVAGGGLAALWWSGVRPETVRDVGLTDFQSAVGAPRDPGDAEPTAADDSTGSVSPLPEVAPEAGPEVAQDPEPERPVPLPELPELQPGIVEPPAAAVALALADEPADDEAADDEAPEDELAVAEEPGPAAASALEATAADGDSAGGVGPDPWQTRSVDPVLAAARQRVLDGHALPTSTERALTRRVRSDRSDPRPHLLLAQSFLHRGAEDASLQRYDLAYRVDSEARGDPRMLRDLLRLATEGSAMRGATRALVRFYGRDALPALDAWRTEGSLSEAQARALGALRGHLQAPPGGEGADLRRASPPARRARSAPRRRVRARAASRHRARRHRARRHRARRGRRRR